MITAVGQQEVALEESRVLVLLRRPDADELLDGSWAASETVRESGSIPGQIHFGQQRRLDRKVRGTGQRRTLDRVRPERFERKKLMVRPFGFSGGLLVTREKRREVPLEGRKKVAVTVV